MSSIENRVKDECIKRLDAHILELVKLKDMLSNGVETKEKVKKICQYLDEIHWKYNSEEQIKGIIVMYWDVLKMIDN